MILSLFKRAIAFGSDQAAGEIEMMAEASLAMMHALPEPTILDRSAGVVSRFLEDARAEKARLESEIAERTERLRQTVVAIEAFEPVLTKLDDGYDPADDARKSYDVAIETKRKRGDRHYHKPAPETPALEAVE